MNQKVKPLEICLPYLKVDIYYNGHFSFIIIMFFKHVVETSILYGFV